MIVMDNEKNVLFQAYERHYSDTKKTLIELLNKATKAYDEGHPIMTDEAWDDLYFQLQELENRMEV